MDDSRCQDFFLQPTQRLHRRYEALRAFFVERRPLREVASHLGYGYGTLRNLIADFRKQCRDDDLPPFSPNRSMDALPAPAANRQPPNRNLLPSLIAAGAICPQDAVCVLVSPASSCSYRCWPVWAWTDSSPRPAILVPARCLLSPLC